MASFYLTICLVFLSFSPIFYAYGRILFYKGNDNWSILKSSDYCLYDKTLGTGVDEDTDICAIRILIGLVLLASSTPSLCFEEHEPSQESDQSCICVLVVMHLCVSGHVFMC
jgi:hypothetical protein